MLTAHRRWGRRDLFGQTHLGAKPGRGPEGRQGAGRRTVGEDQGVRSLGRDADRRMSWAYLHEPKY